MAVKFTLLYFWEKHADLVSLRRALKYNGYAKLT